MQASINAVFPSIYHFDAFHLRYFISKETIALSLLRLNVAKAMMNNTKMFFSGGDSVVGSILGNVFGDLQGKKK